ncbi:MAG TPA: GAF domain-containing protein [Capillimicrobium sp.]|jgi:signal transduction histidine kinase
MPPETAPADAVDLIVGLLGQVDEDDFHLAPRSEFYSRLCQAVCELVPMSRALLFLYDDVRRAVRPMGSHGFDPAVVEAVNAPLEGSALMRRALDQDRVIVLAGPFSEEELPGEYVRAFDLKAVACTPLSAAGRWRGVIFSDRDGAPFALTGAERDRLHSLGKTAALAATARVATRQQLLAQQLAERLDLARELHDSVIQRLFGITALLRSGEPLEDGQRERCAVEAERAMEELRELIERPLAHTHEEAHGTLAEELDRIERMPGQTPLRVTWHDDCAVPPAYEPLVQTVLREALRNADKHAAATAIDVDVECDEEALHLTVVNDGVLGGDGRGRGAGVGLRLCALEALRHGGLVEFGASGPDRWRVRLVLPLEP